MIYSDRREEPVGKISPPSSLRVPECFVQDDRPAGHVSWRDGERGFIIGELFGKWRKIGGELWRAITLTSSCVGSQPTSEISDAVYTLHSWLVRSISKH